MELETCKIEKIRFLLRLFTIIVCFSEMFMIGYYLKLIMIEFVPKINKSKTANLTLLEIAFCMKNESVVCKSAK